MSLHLLSYFFLSSCQEGLHAIVRLVVNIINYLDKFHHINMYITSCISLIFSMPERKFFCWEPVLQFFLRFWYLLLTSGNKISELFPLICLLSWIRTFTNHYAGYLKILFLHLYLKNSCYKYISSLVGSRK